LLAQQVGELAALTGWPHRLGVAQARLKAAQGDLYGALALLDEAERQYVRNPLPDQSIAAMKARVWIRLGRLGEAERWAQQQSLSADDDLHYSREFEHLTLARGLTARYRADRNEATIGAALRLLDRLLQAAEEGNRTGSVIEIVMLQALALHAQDDLPSAITALERALTLAEPEGYVQLFVAEGEPLRLLIADFRSLIEKQKRGSYQKTVAYIDRLQAAFAPAALPQSEIRNQKSKMVEPLSERELEVLKLLGTELSGPEIASKLSVSLNTVRTHTKNIYSKLGVNSRRAAIRRAEELALL
jgi:LuxR family transcriptional regulator, maltose regulon positive regulatory protein